MCKPCPCGRKASFNPAIFDDHSPYAVTGEEQDIGTRHGWQS